MHPDDAMARRQHNQRNGKTEMWYVVAADPGACLYSGMKVEITPEEYERRVSDGTITDVLKASAQPASRSLHSAE